MMSSSFTDGFDRPSWLLPALDSSSASPRELRDLYDSLVDQLTGATTSTTTTEQDIHPPPCGASQYLNLQMVCTLLLKAQQMRRGDGRDVKALMNTMQESTVSSTLERSGFLLRRLRVDDSTMVDFESSLRVEWDSDSNRCRWEWRRSDDAESDDGGDDDDLMNLDPRALEEEERALIQMAETPIPSETT